MKRSAFRATARTPRRKTRCGFFLEWPGNATFGRLPTRHRSPGRSVSIRSGVAPLQAALRQVRSRISRPRSCWRDWRTRQRRYQVEEGIPRRCRLARRPWPHLPRLPRGRVHYVGRGSENNALAGSSSSILRRESDYRVVASFCNSSAALVACCRCSGARRGRPARPA